jgi:hypothetical protein
VQKEKLIIELDIVHNNEIALEKIRKEKWNQLDTQLLDMKK